MNKEESITEMLPERARTPKEGSNRSMLIAMLKDYEPDMADEPDDETLFEYAKKGFSERNDLKGKYEEINSANERLAEAISNEPSLARFIGMIANGANPWYALGKSFGNMVDQLDDASLEELQRGQEENRKKVEMMRKNFSEYEKTLKQYVQDNSLSESDAENINNAILDIADALNNGEITLEVIDNVWKGLDYDNEKTAELEAAKLSGRNEAIEEVKSKKAPVTPIPDLITQKTNRMAMPKRPLAIKNLTDMVQDKE